MKKITRNYSLLIGEGSRGKVYKGYLSDFTIVAVTVWEIKLNGYLKEDFLEQAVIRAQMVHTNIIKLTGYCVETNVLAIVHEYAANGSLQEILHGNKNKCSL
jgi:serine/threonine protein kinase